MGKGSEWIVIDIVKIVRCGVECVCGVRSCVRMCGRGSKGANEKMYTQSLNAVHKFIFVCGIYRPLGGCRSHLRLRHL